MNKTDIELWWLFQIAYRDICSNQAYLVNTIMDPAAQVPYTYANHKWISYDNPAAFLTKVKYNSAFITFILHKTQCGELFHSV